VTGLDNFRLSQHFGTEVDPAFGRQHYRLCLPNVFSGTDRSKMGRGCWGASVFFADFMKIGHLMYTSKTSGFCLYEGRVTCSLSVFESRVLSVMLKHKSELIRGEIANFSKIIVVIFTVHRH